MANKQAEKAALSPRSISLATPISGRTKEDDREGGEKSGTKNSDLGIPPKQPHEDLILQRGVQNRHDHSPGMAALILSLPFLNGNIY